MKTLSHSVRLLLLWVFLSAVLATLTHHTAQRQVASEVAQRLHKHLLLSLDESLFSKAENSVKDTRTLRNVADKINLVLGGFVHSKWFAPLQQCTVEIQALDGIAIGATPASPQLILELPGDQLDRDVVVDVNCKISWLGSLLPPILLGLLFLTIHRLVPPPLSAEHRRWINYLLTHGYSGQAAYELVQHHSPQDIRLSAEQRDVLEQIHDPTSQNFAHALAVASDPRIASLDAESREWLLLGLSSADHLDLEGALALACCSNKVEIDLTRGRLLIHGREIATAKTPLFYYAWYALQRSSGSGWFTNPASNRPDTQSGEQLAQLMWRHGGHAKAISDLEQVGLKAKTLDQNRSKMKDELVAALGSHLAERYLFDSQRHTDGVRMAYRLRPSTDQISIILSPNEAAD